MEPHPVILLCMGVCDSTEQFTKVDLSGVCACLLEWLIEFNDHLEEIKAGWFRGTVLLSCVDGLPMHRCELIGVTVEDNVHAAKQFISVCREYFPKLMVQGGKQWYSQEGVLIND